MSLRLAWLGAVLMVFAAACANLWQFSDLQTSSLEDASINPEQPDSSEDSTAPQARFDGFGGPDVHSDVRTSDVASDVTDAGHPDAVTVVDAMVADHECATTVCSGACVDPATDPANCGTCANACPHGAMCMAGACKCPAAQPTPCGGVCVDMASDHNNCGGCGNACQAGYRCSNRTCVPCQSTDKMCGGVCVDVETDIANCGSCGVQCPSGATCASGTCTCPTADPSVCPGSGGGQQCVTLASDNNNCGGCGNVCSLAHATSTCTSSACAISACRGAWVDCDQMASDGCEANTITDTTNCGGCGHVCNLPHASPMCLLGLCAIQSCSPGYGDCDLLPPNGCEVNTGADPNNCGGCGNVCNLPHASSNCTMGSCTIASCNAGFADCDGVASNGCETDLSQPANCGTCGKACGSGMLCSAGSCVSMCSGSMPTLCNGAYCANTTNDVNNCGSCGKVCSLANATATCTSSNCAVASCTSGFADCNKTASDGCEVNTTNDVGNCGGCGKACNLANATSTCSASSCAVKSCNSGFADCNTTAGDGCEVNTNTDSNNCSMCGMKCTGGMTCQSGACACPSGTHNCNGTCQSNTDPNYCGTTCGMSCSLNLCFASYTCPSGSCVGSSPVVCTALDQCHTVGTCDPTSGACSNPTVTDGTACTNSSNKCNGTYTCQGGMCKGSNPVTCTASDQCHVAGTCDPTSGACSNPTATDGTACTGAAPGMTCQGGTCSCAPATLCTPTDGGAPVCANTQSDIFNCGTCNTPCSQLSDGGPPACNSAICGM